MKNNNNNESGELKIVCAIFLFSFCLIIIASLFVPFVNPSLGQSYNQLRFHDRVFIKEGFYQGYYGTVYSNSCYKGGYGVEVDDGLPECFMSYDLQKIEEPKK